MFTLDTFKEIFKLYENQKPPEYGISVSMDWLIHFDFEIERLVTEKVRWFYTTTSKARDYAEFTPYNKWNLFKVRRYWNKTYKVFFGTKELCYTTSLQDCINYIKKSQWHC